MAPNAVLVFVGMRVHCLPKWSNCFRNPTKDSRQVQNSQKNQHQAYRQFHREPYSFGNHNAEQNDCRTNNENHDRMTNSPENPNKGGMANGPLAAHNRGHRNDVVRVGCVAHAGKKAQNYDGNQGDHLSPDPLRRCAATLHSPAFKNLDTSLNLRTCGPLLERLTF
jgi:hypothetical protein